MKSSDCSQCGHSEQDHRRDETYRARLVVRGGLLRGVRCSCGCIGYAPMYAWRVFTVGSSVMVGTTLAMVRAFFRRPVFDFHGIMTIVVIVLGTFYTIDLARSAWRVRPKVHTSVWNESP